jgi:hypothetical protein
MTHEIERGNTFVIASDSFAVDERRNASAGEVRSLPGRL